MDCNTVIVQENETSALKAVGVEILSPTLGFYFLLTSSSADLCECGECEPLWRLSVCSE